MGARIRDSCRTSEAPRSYRTTEGARTLSQVLHKHVNALAGSGVDDGGLSVDTPILTTTGWQHLSDLAEGDQVFDEQGMPCSITGVCDQPTTRTCLEVEFSDGTVIITGGVHLWWTEDRPARVSRSRNISSPTVPGRLRKQWRSPAVTTRLRQEADAARPDDAITIPEVADLAGVHPTTQRLYRLAEMAGPR